MQISKLKQAQLLQQNHYNKWPELS